MKRIIGFCVFMLVVSLGWSQQEEMYTQFMYNKQAINPAFVSNTDAWCASFTYRNQWAGFPGAPKSQLFSLSSPQVYGNSGFGINLRRNTIGISERITFDGMYSYRIQLGEGDLSFGIQAALRRLKVDFTDERLRTAFPLAFDQAVDGDVFDKTLLNAGFGMYYNTEKWYAGFSIPRMMPADIDFDQYETNAREVQHVYFMGGGSYRIDQDWEIVPQLLIKYSVGAPIDLDINLSGVYQERLTAGLTYRAGGDGFGESIDLLAAFQVNPAFLLGLSYDIGLSGIRSHHNGSLEAMLSYCFGVKERDNREIINPRYF